MPGETYYWRVRVGQQGPAYSAWSETRSFTVEAITSLTITAPMSGATGVSTTPTFVWTAVKDATAYEVAIAPDPAFEGIVDWAYNLTNTFYKYQADKLDNSTTYYVRVRADGGPWATATFTTEAAPTEAAPPVVIEPTPPTEVKIVEVPVTQPAAIPDALLWAIVAIGAVLVIALIVLIVRTRRVV